MVAMSQVCMKASPVTEMAASPQIPNSITVKEKEEEDNGRGGEVKEQNRIFI